MPLTIVPAIIVGTMVTMYITVRKIERMILNYGTSVLRLRAHQRQSRVVDYPNSARGSDNHTSPSIFFETLKGKLVIICLCVFRNDYALRSNNARFQKRAVLYMAMSYSLTWGIGVDPFLSSFLISVIRQHLIYRRFFNPFKDLHVAAKGEKCEDKKRGKLCTSYPDAKRSSKHGCQEVKRREGQSLAVDTPRLLRCCNVLSAVYLDSWIYASRMVTAIILS